MTNSSRQIILFIVMVATAAIMMAGFFLAVALNSWFGLLLSGAAFVGAALLSYHFGRCWRCGQPLSRTALGFYAPIYARVCNHCGVRSNVTPGPEVQDADLHVESAPILRIVTGLFGIVMLAPAAVLVWLAARGFELRLEFPGNVLVFVPTVFGLLCLFIAIRGRRGL